MLYRISVTERGLTGIANIFRSRLSRLDDLLGAGTVPLSMYSIFISPYSGSPPCLARRFSHSEYSNFPVNQFIDANHHLPP